MPRRAEWRSLPDESKGGLVLLRVWARDVWMLTEVAETTLVVGAIGLGIACFIALVLFATPLTILYLTSLALLWGMGLVGLAWFRKLDRRYRGLPPPANRPRPLPAGLESILPLPLPEGTFPAHVAIRYRGILTGLDVAAASFVEGWLHVEGRRAGFALRAGEGRAEWRGGTTLRVTFPDDQAIDLRVSSGLKLEAHFRHAATLWIADRDHPEGEPILPPHGVHPVVRAGRRCATLLTWLAVGALLLFALRPGTTELEIIAILAFTGVAALGSHIASVAPSLEGPNRAGRRLTKSAAEGEEA